MSPDVQVPTVGASGAIAAVLGGYMLLYPRAQVLTIIFLFFFFTFVEIPAMVMLGIWLLLQFLPAIGQLATPDLGGEGGGVAYFAHIGGFLCGLALDPSVREAKIRAVRSSRKILSTDAVEGNDPTDDSCRADLRVVVRGSCCSAR